MFEKIILNKINEKRIILEECQLQYGFRKGKSTEDAINKLCTKIDNLKAEEYRYVLTIFFFYI